MTREGRLVIDDPEVQRRLVKAIESYMAVYRKGCTPPDAVNWDNSYEDNKAFLAQTVVMVPNYSLSIPNALKRERPDDYYKNTATISGRLGRAARPSRSQRTSSPRWSSRTAAQSQRQGVRPFPGRRGLANALSQFFW